MTTTNIMTHDLCVVGTFPHSKMHQSGKSTQLVEKFLAATGQRHRILVFRDREFRDDRLDSHSKLAYVKSKDPHSTIMHGGGYFDFTPLIEVLLTTLVQIDEIRPGQRIFLAMDDIYPEELSRLSQQVEKAIVSQFLQTCDVQHTPHSHGAYTEFLSRIDFACTLLT